MQRLLAVFVATLVSGCATQTPPADQPTIAAVADRNARLQQTLDTAREMALRLRANDAMSISYYAAGPCDTRDASLPDKPQIADLTFRRAIRRERYLKFQCADRHDHLRSQSKNALGVFRQRIDHIIGSLR